MFTSNQLDENHISKSVLKSRKEVVKVLDCLVIKHDVASSANINKYMFLTLNDKPSANSKNKRGPKSIPVGHRLKKRMTISNDGKPQRTN